MWLGLDIGTTKVAAVVADSDGAAKAVVAVDHRADRPAPRGRAEQDPDVLFEACQRAVSELPADSRRQVRGVGLTGQMHGVLVLDSTGRPLSPLITWQDGRGLEGSFVETLAARTGRSLATGFGCATLAWLAAHELLPPAAASAGTIQDYAAMALCGQSRPVTDPTDAASWGLFDLRRLQWDLAAVKSAGFNAALLPEVRPCGSRAGELSAALARDFGLPPGIPVTVALGDNQASLLATLEDPLHEIAITLGTGAQASAVLAPDAPLEEPAAGRTFEYRPYPGQRYLATAAPLAGGSAWAWLARTVASWERDLGRPDLPEDALYERLNALGLAAVNAPLVTPHFLGERHAPELRAAIAQLGPQALSLGSLARGLACGIVTNLRDMLPQQVLAGRRRLVGSGNALRRNALLRAMAEEVFALPLRMPSSREEAARGAALNAATGQRQP